MRGLVAVCALALATFEPAVVFRTIARGADSRVSVHREIVARTAGWWSVLWHEHAGNYEVPPIDFSKEMVIALFAGRRDAEAAVELVSVTRARGSVVVRYRVHGAAAARAAANATSPFVMIAVPADRSPVRFIDVDASPDER